jgi:hypothetical protein
VNVMTLMRMQAVSYFYLASADAQYGSDIRFHAGCTSQGRAMSITSKDISRCVRRPSLGTARPGAYPAFDMFLVLPPSP